MLSLSTDRINSMSPYTVIQCKDGDFLFHSENGVDYNVGFIEEFEIGGCQSYQLSIANINNAHGSYDPGIRQTILAIIDEFFYSNQNVLLYICDSSDGREAIRNRLFLSWFSASEGEAKYTLRTAESIVEGIGFYVAIIVDNTNPKLEAILRDFEDSSEHLSK